MVIVGDNVIREWYCSNTNVVEEKGLFCKKFARPLAPDPGGLLYTSGNPPYQLLYNLFTTILHYIRIYYINLHFYID